MKIRIGRVSPGDELLQRCAPARVFMENSSNFTRNGASVFDPPLAKPKDRLAITCYPSAESDKPSEEFLESGQGIGLGGNSLVEP